MSVQTTEETWGQILRRLGLYTARVLLLFGFVVWTMLPPPESAAAGASPGTLRCDFDADGYEELVIGAPGEGATGMPDHGIVHVLRGGPDGPSAAGDADRILSQATPGVPGAREAGDRFGSAVACGDFDGDGFDDLAVGVPGEDVGSIVDAGAVVVFSGSGDGLGTATLWTQATPGIKGAANRSDGFGSALAVGDFDGDGFDDLAVGVPGDDRDIGVAEDKRGVGAVSVLYGSALGISNRDQRWTQDDGAVPGTAELGDGFGWAVAAGDIDGDGVDDLVIGVPFEDVGSGAMRAGTINVVYGTEAGLRSAGSQAISVDSSGIQGVSGHGNEFGRSLTVADLDGDGYDDVVVGEPGATVGGDEAAGVVHVLYGAAGGVSARDELWSQDTAGIKSTAKEAEWFGWALAAADFDGDGDVDLAIGTPFDEVDGIVSGSVTVLLNTGSGLGDEDQHLSQSGAIYGVAEGGDAFGESLAVGDLDGDGRVDLVVGAPGEDVGTRSDAGAVHVVFGATSGLTSAGNQGWSQESPGMKGVAEAEDSFGFVDRAASDIGDVDFTPTIDWNRWELVRKTSSTSVVFGEDEWLYNNGTFSLSCGLDVADAVTRIDRIRRIVEASGRQFIIAIPPDKPWVYDEHLGVLDRRTDCLRSQHDALVAAASAFGGAWIDTVTPVLALEEAQRDGEPVYYPNDTHWTTRAAMQFAERFVEHVEAGVWQPQAVVTETRLHTGDLTKTAGYPYQVETEWFDVARTDVTVTRVDDNDRFGPRIWHVEGSGPFVDGRLFGLHDSFMREARDYVGAFFRDTELVDWRVFFDGRGLDLPVDWIGPRAELADVISMQVTERFVDRRFDERGQVLLAALVGGLWHDLPAAALSVPPPTAGVVTLPAPSQPGGATTFVAVDVTTAGPTILEVSLVDGGAVVDTVEWNALDAGTRGFAVELPGGIDEIRIRTEGASVDAAAVYRLFD